MVSGGAQLGRNIWNGVNAFISPGAYAHAHDPYSDTGVIGSRPKNEVGQGGYQFIQDGADYRNRMTPGRARTLQREREVQAAKNQILNL